jgi:nitroreductase
VIVLVYVSPAEYAERYSLPDKAASGLGSPVGKGESAWTVPYWYFDAGASVMALLLGAVDAGLGACFLGNFRGEQELSQSLGVTVGWRFTGAVLLGEPGGDDPPSPSLSLGRPEHSQLVHYGSWRNESRS